jgi:hypothetical protein
MSDSRDHESPLRKLMADAQGVSYRGSPHLRKPRGIMTAQSSWKAMMEGKYMSSPQP